MKAQLWWVGHLVWMDNTCLPKMVFFSELVQVTLVAHWRGSKMACRNLLVFSALLLLDGKPSPQTAMPGNDLRQGCYTLWKRAAARPQTEVTGLQGKENWPKYCSRMPLVWSHLCVELWAAFSPSASLTFSLLTMDFTNVLIWLLMITRGIRP